MSIQNEIILKEKIMNKIILLKTVDSTNNYIKENTTTLDDRTVVIAKNQTAGRGRFKRNFVSEAGGLYMSVLLKNFSTELLTVCMGVSTADILCELGADVKIKWVNDIYCEGKKICGILTEVVNNCVVIGLGVNIKHSESIPETASSLEKLYGIDINTVTLGECIINKFFSYIDNFNPTHIIGRYRLYTAYMVGQHITYNSGEGIVTAVLDNGNLAIKNLTGDDIVLNSGEVSIKMERI